MLGTLPHQQEEFVLKKYIDRRNNSAVKHFNAEERQFPAEAAFPFLR